MADGARRHIDPGIADSFCFRTRGFYRGANFSHVFPCCPCAGSRTCNVLVFRCPSRTPRSRKPGSQNPGIRISRGPMRGLPTKAQRGVRWPSEVLGGTLTQGRGTRHGIQDACGTDGHLASDTSREHAGCGCCKLFYCKCLLRAPIKHLSEH